MIPVSFVGVYEQNLHSAQVGDNQTDTSNMLLVKMPKFWRKTLIKHVGFTNKVKRSNSDMHVF